MTNASSNFMHPSKEPARHFPKAGHPIHNDHRPAMLQLMIRPYQTGGVEDPNTRIYRKYVEYGYCAYHEGQEEWRMLPAGKVALT